MPTATASVERHSRTLAYANLIRRGRDAAVQLESAAEDRIPELNDAIRAANQARDEFITANRPLALSIARRYINRGLPFEDLAQEAVIGLMKAVDRFDPDRGVQFSTYATPWIREACHEAVNTASRIVRRPSEVEDALRKLYAIRMSFIEATHRPPTVPELAERAGISERKIQWLLSADRVEVSLDAPHSGGDNLSSYADTLPDEDARTAFTDVDNSLTNAVRHAELAILMDRCLDDLQRAVLAARFGSPGTPARSVRQVAADLGMPPTRIRAVESAALRALRNARHGSQLQAAA